jgi:hypothetical protein
MRLSALFAAALCVALLAAGCGGGSGSTTPGGGGETNGATTEGGAPKKATAPNAPAGSKVVSCPVGGGDDEVQLRATAVDCRTARATVAGWAETDSCALAADASRGSCSVAGFRCQAVRAEFGLAVSCARPGGDVAFIVKE